MQNKQTDKLHFRKKLGFTLAEVLITLGIIGVVAAMTIPVLLKSSQNLQYVNAFKTIYTDLNQAFARYAVDSGCIGDLGCTGLYSGNTTDNVTKWDNFVNKYLSVAKNCGITSDLDCFPYFIKDLNISSGTGRYMNSESGAYRIVLNNGASIAFYSNADNCTSYTNVSTSNLVYGYCGQIRIDINGLSGPNIEGRDSFLLSVSKLHGVNTSRGSASWAEATNTKHWTDPSGGNQYNCTMSAQSRGNACSARIIDEGWEMNY